MLSSYHNLAGTIIHGGMLLVTLRYLLKFQTAQQLAATLIGSTGQYAVSLQGFYQAVYIKYLEVFGVPELQGGNDALDVDSEVVSGTTDD